MNEWKTDLPRLQKQRINGSIHIRKKGREEKERPSHVGQGGGCPAHLPGLYGLGMGHKCPRCKQLWKRQQELMEAET